MQAARLPAGRLQVIRARHYSANDSGGGDPVATYRSIQDMHEARDDQLLVLVEMRAGRPQGRLHWHGSVHTNEPCHVILAFERAGRVLLGDETLKGVVVLVDPKVRWDPAWGELIPSPILK